jgi:hypothetical protein
MKIPETLAVGRQGNLTPLFFYQSQCQGYREKKGKNQCFFAGIGYIIGIDRNE